MGLLVLQPTVTAQWYSLVRDAEEASVVNLNEDLESYLVFLLLRFAKHPEFSSDIVALDFLRSIQLTDRTHHEMLRDVGDKCLLTAGFFPGLAQKRLVRVSYYVELGKRAYATLANDRDSKDQNELYKLLYEQFVRLVDVLLAIRSLSGKESVLLPIEAAELWSDTGSLQALQLLQRFTQKK